MGDRLYAEVQLGRSICLVSLRADMDKEVGMEDELLRLKEFRDLVYFIANDYHELSYEKAVWQRDDWKRRCNKLIEELESDDDSDSVPGHPHIEGDND